MAKPISKVIFGDQVLLDLTGDTVSVDKLAKGITAHDKSGAPIVGINTFDSDTSDATAAVAEILEGKTAYTRGAKVVGTMPNNGSVKKELERADTPVSIPPGYHDGSGSVGMNSSDKAKLIPENIRKDIEILGVVGNMTGTEDVKAQAKTFVPTKEGMTLHPDTGFNYLSQVTIKPIPYTLSDNAAGGQTATIG